MLILCYIPDQQHWYQHFGFGFEKIQKSRRKLNTYGQLKHRINCDQDQHWWKFRYSSDLFENFSTGYSFLITYQQNSQEHNSNMASVYEWNQLPSCSKLTKSCDHFCSQVSLICKHPWWFKSVHSSNPLQPGVLLKCLVVVQGQNTEILVSISMGWWWWWWCQWTSFACNSSSFFLIVCVSRNSSRSKPAKRRKTQGVMKSSSLMRSRTT